MVDDIIKHSYLFHIDLPDFDLTETSSETNMDMPVSLPHAL